MSDKNTVWYLTPIDGESSGAMIQETVDKSKPGDTIVLGIGYYQIVSPIIITKDTVLSIHP